MAAMADAHRGIDRAIVADDGVHSRNDQPTLARRAAKIG
jgi:hypothetical protein